MIYGYIRVSTDKQTTENQRFEILKFADEKTLRVDCWIEETISAARKLSDRKLGALIERMHEDDILIVSELSRLGRSLLEVMSILHTLMEKEVKVFTTKERYETLAGALESVDFFASRVALRMMIPMKPSPLPGAQPEEQ